MYLNDLAAYESGVMFLDVEIPEGMHWTPNERCCRHCGWPTAWCPYRHHHADPATPANGTPPAA